MSTVLSYKSALALIPPSSITKPIEAVRSVFDERFRRWPPHITIIYPFLASPTDRERGYPVLSRHIRGRIKAATNNIEPFHVQLDTRHLGMSPHGHRSASIWMRPTTHQIQLLQLALEDEFSECNRNWRPAVPHLCVGQAHPPEGPKPLSKAIKKSVADFLSDADAATSTSLDWKVDSIFVLEHDDEDDRFRITGTIELKAKKARPPLDSLPKGSSTAGLGSSSE